MDGEIESTCPRHPLHRATDVQPPRGGSEDARDLRASRASSLPATRCDATRPAVARSADSSSSFVSFFVLP